MDVGALIAACEASRAQADHATGVAQARQILALPQLTEPERAQVRALLSLHALRVNELETSVREGQLALQHYQEAGDRSAQSRLHSTLALAYLDSQLHQHALRHAVDALEAARACGDLRAECWAMSRASSVYEGLCDFERSLDFGRRALALARSLDDPEVLFATLNNLASTGATLAKSQLDQGGAASTILQQALADAQEAVALACEQHSAHREGVARSNTAAILMLLARYGEAREQVELSYRLALERSYRGLALELEVDLSELARLERKPEEAMARSHALLARIDPQQDVGLAMRLHTLLYELHKERSQFELALSNHERMHVLQLNEARQIASLQSRILLNKLELDEARHQAEQARRDAVLQRMRAEELDRDAHTDALTGLLNRRFLHRQLPLLMARAHNHGRSLSAAMIDIDHFKLINDGHGHDVGDRVLASLAGLLRQATRGSDVAVRMGGEEFLVVLVDAPLHESSEACERLRHAVQAHAWNDLVPGLSCTVSVGLATLAPAEPMDGWLKRIDQALYEAKRGGRNQVVASS